MSSYARCSSQLPEDFDSSSSSLTLGVFGSGRSSGASLNRDYKRETKRRKVSGTNSRFDRMIETISRSPIKASSSRRRQRTRSIGSSSTSYCDLPRTPIDAYDGRQAGPLGKDFALIKMDAGAVTLNEFRQDALKTTSNHQDTRPLPPWLSITLTGLDSKHPLRLLLPKSPQPPPPGLVDDSEGINVEDDPVFSFLPTDLSPDSVTSDGLAAGYVNMEKDELHLSNSSTIVKVLPFSTPGPGSLLSEWRPPFSATMHTSSHVQNATIVDSIRNTGLNCGAQDLDFVPFSTPGPGSLTLKGDSRSKSPRLPAVPQDPKTVVDPNMFPFPDVLPFSMPGPALAATLVSPDTSCSLPSAELCLPSYIASMSDTAPGYSSDDMPDFNTYCNDPCADDSASDPSFEPCAYTQPLPNLFATPGPGYRPPQRIYFDSPTEDPSDSDSLQPGCDIDYEALGFHWEPFNRKNINAMEPEETMMSIPLQQASSGVDVDVEPDRQQESTKQDHSHPPPSLRHVLSPSPFAFSACSQSEAYTNGHGRPTQQSESQRQMPPAFAPAPGIFLSPLRDAVLPDKRTFEPTMPDDKTNLLGILDKLYTTPEKLPIKHITCAPSNSQESYDSIESWHDVDI